MTGAEIVVSTERTKTTALVVTVRVMYADGEVAYIGVRGTALAQAAVVAAWQQAEMERPGVPIVSADVGGITEDDREDPPEEGDST